MNESYTYKCPSCGAKVKYIEEARHWKCEYCKNTYTNLFPTENEELEGVDEYTTFNYYYCDNCKSGYYTKEKDSVCYKCHGKVTGKKEKIYGTISRTFNSNEAAVCFNRFFDRYKEFLPSCFFSRYNVINTYLNCDLYTGYIIVTNGVRLTKYFFVNTLIPHIKTDNYRIIYDFANIGFSSTDNFEVDPKYNYTVDVGSHDLEVSNENIISKLKDACKHSFIETYGDNGEIKVLDDIDCRKNILLRTFYCSFNYDGKEYRNYVIGDYNRYFIKKQNVALSFPLLDGITQDNALATYRDTYKSGSFLQGMGITFLIFSIPFAVILITILGIIAGASGNVILTGSVLAGCFVLGGAILVAGGLATYFGYKKLKKAEYIWYSINASEKDFYYNLVNNSNYVKKVCK